MPAGFAVKFLRTRIRHAQKNAPGRMQQQEEFFLDQRTGFIRSLRLSAGGTEHD
ncbi:MAG: hypothetical protein KF771_12850 [Burkholderiales bacterium]|nr:hypothetical protein [Burkholderiales bacterium]